MKFTPEQQQRLRELRVEAALLDCTVNTNEFWEAAAAAIRFQSAALRRRTVDITPNEAP